MNQWKKLIAAAAALAFFSTQVHASGGAPAEPERGYTETDYPIVMIGGFLAFEKILGVDYFYGIPGSLADDGATVYPVNVSAFNGTYVRGEQLINKLEQLKATHGHSKFNLLGHSGGATTIRYVAEARPDLVASVTSVHGSNAGVPVADIAHQILGDGNVAHALYGLLDIFGTVVEFIGGHDPSDYPMNALEMMTFYRTDISEAFNAEYPAGMPTQECGEGAHSVNGIRYYSWGGTSNLTNPLDLLDPVFTLGGLMTPGDNDGLITRCGSHLGDVIRDDYAHNHGDAINHLFGFLGLFASDPKQLYRQHANRMQNAGL